MTLHLSGRLEWHQVHEVYVEILDLTEDTIVASEILGLMRPHVGERSDNESQEGSVDLAAAVPLAENNRRRWRWPTLQRAVDWLRGQSIVTVETLGNIVTSARNSVFESGTLTEAKDIVYLKSKIAESIRDGSSVSEFHAAVKDTIAVTRRESETLLRTNTKRAYLEAQKETLDKSSRIKALFPYVLYVGTQDARSRPWHLALDGMIAEVDSPLHDTFLKVQSEYNCRCALVVLSEARLRGRKVSTISDLPAEFMSKF